MNERIEQLASDIVDELFARLYLKETALRDDIIAAVADVLEEEEE